MKIFNKPGTKERLFEMMQEVNKIKLNESFDSPKDKDEKFLDKTYDSNSPDKYDGGYDYPVIAKLRVDDPSLEKVVGEDEDGDTEQQLDGELTDQDIANYDYDHNNLDKTYPIPNDALGTGDDENISDVKAEFNDELEGGLADDDSPMEFDNKEILKGIEVEMEHTNDPKIAVEIAMDHLKENPNYYTELEDFEGEKDIENKIIFGERGEVVNEEFKYKPKNIVESEEAEQKANKLYKKIDWKKDSPTKNHPNYNHPDSKDHKKVVDKTVDGLEKKVGDIEDKKVEKKLKDKISAGIS